LYAADLLNSVPPKETNKMKMAEFLQKLVRDKKIHEARAFNFTYRYIDSGLSINNSRFAKFLPLIYPTELEIKEITDTASPCKLHIQEKLVYYCTYLENL
jgi:hypothetical protein